MMGCLSPAPAPSPPPTSYPGCYSGNKLNITISTIGTVAREELERAGQASVIGRTSRGLYLHLASDWVVFLSFGPYRGPLTLNLHGNPETFADLGIGTEVYCSDGFISFPSKHLTLPLAQAASWQAAEPAGKALSSDLLQAGLLSVLHLAAQGYPDRRLVALLHGMISGQPALEPSDPVFYPPLRRLQAACQEGPADAIVSALEGLLGLGPGLTPSGDDLVMGFLLAMSRWSQRASSQEAAFYSQQLLPSLHRLTGHLSASLITCAGRGQADERLIQALDGLVTGSLEAEACVRALSTWGSSSGFDALAGMVIFLMPGQS